MPFQYKSLNRKSSSLNNTRRSTQPFRMLGNGQPYTAATIGFTAGATIADSAETMPVYPAGTLLRVSGSTVKNNRVFKVASGDNTSYTLAPAIVLSETEGATITIRSV